MYEVTVLDPSRATGDYVLVVNDVSFDDVGIRIYLSATEWTFYPYSSIVSVVKFRAVEDPAWIEMTVEAPVRANG